MGGTLEGSTTWCDSDSCASDSKCYCAPEDIKKKKNGKKGAKKSGDKTAGGNDNFALDYELFTVGSSSKNVRPTEALSVKKTVEMAAVFADVKLSQTTDITNLKPNKASGKGKAHHHKKNKNSTKQHDEIVAVKNYKNSATRSKVDDQLEAMRTAETALKAEGYYQTVAQRPVSTSLEDSLGYLP